LGNPPRKNFAAGSDMILYNTDRLEMAFQGQSRPPHKVLILAVFRCKFQAHLGKASWLDVLRNTLDWKVMLKATIGYNASPGERIACN
jgi:hypothetical protein